MTIDPELFRIKVGNYKDRWYIDPLAACDIAPQDLNWQAPAVSTIKKASSKDWTQIAVGRAADWIHRHQISFDGQDKDTIYSALSQANSNALDLASTRGVQIHKMFEVFAEGGDPGSVELGYEAEAYRATVLRCIRTLKPDIRLSEFLAMSRTQGYGGTGDAVWRIEGWPTIADGLYLVDYKSRSAKMAVYIEEAWQVASYAKADYYIVEDDGYEHDGTSAEVMRIYPPEFKGGLILSITPTDYGFYPIDIEASWPGFLTLRDHWQHRRNGTKNLFGKMWAPPRSRDAWIRDRIEQIKTVNIAPLLAYWPEEVPKPKKCAEYTDAQVDLLIWPCDYAEKQLSLPFGRPDPALERPAPTAEDAHKWIHTITGTTHTDPDLTESEATEDPAGIDYAAVQEATYSLPAEGELTPATLPIIAQRYAALKGPQQEWISSIVVEANECDLPIRVAEQPTERRVAIAKALIRCAEFGLSMTQIRGAFLGCTFLTEDALDHMTFGAAIGSLDYREAKAFLELIKLLPDEHNTWDITTPDSSITIDPRMKDWEKVEKISPKEKAKPATTVAKPRKAAAKKAAAPKPTTRKKASNAK